MSRSRSELESGCGRSFQAHWAYARECPRPCLRPWQGSWCMSVPGHVWVAPAWGRNSGLSAGPVNKVRESSAETAHSVGFPDGVMWMMTTIRNQFVLECLIRTWYPSGDLKMSLRRRDRSTLLHRKPKKTSVMVAQRFRWSKLVSTRKEGAEGA